MKVETYIIDSIASSPIEQTIILVIMHVRMFKTYIIVPIGDVMCLTSS